MEPLFAYIDPGSGSLLIQAVIAGLVAIPIFFRHQISRAIRAVRGGSETVPTSATSAPAAPSASAPEREDTTPGA
jgi:hypothetical protein